MTANTVIEIPIRVGQIVYTVHDPWNADCHIEPYIVSNISITQNKKGIWTKKFRAVWYPDGKVRQWSHDFDFDAIGCLVFFDKDKAERELLHA